MFRALDQNTRLPSLIPSLASLRERRASDTPAKADGEKTELVVIGHGMVSQHFCKEVTRLGLIDSHNVTVISEEDAVAYDRVNLTRVLKGAEKQSVALTSQNWFDKVGITLKLGEPVVSVDRDKKLVQTTNGAYAYDKLVFASGSKPVVPKITGLDHPKVLVYRTLEDALKLRDQAAECSKKGLPAVVIGAGLLGVEAAEALKSLGCNVELVESATHLMSRQLDADAAEYLERVLLEAGFTLHMGVRLERVEVEEDSYALHLEDGATLAAGLVLVATGVRPRDEVARDAGISCDLFGGILVDGTLASSDPHIFAVGECARHKGQAYGVVAPGYLMADTLAARMAGKRNTFDGTEVTTRLKIPDIELTCVGESNVRDLATRCLQREKDASLQQIVVRKGRVVGATSIGAWDELPKVQQAISTRQKIQARHIKRFESEGTLWPNQTVNLKVWPDTATVCGCTGATCGVLRQAKAAGAITPQALSNETGAGTVCGSCVPLLESMCGVETEEPSHRTLVTASVLGLLLAAYALFGPSIPYAQTVQVPFSWDDIWRDSLTKQITGFSLFGVAVLASALSLRKRVSKVQFGRFSSWRTVHSVLGVLCLVGIGVHTGFRLGSNLDMALGITFLTMTVVGAVAGAATALERKIPNGRGVTLRKWSSRLHLWLTWPLPVLVLFHVLKVYFF